MMSTMQKWFLIVALWACLLFAGVSFYWSHFRPGNVRAACARKAQEELGPVKPGQASKAFEVYRALYSDCCRNNGVKD